MSVIDILIGLLSFLYKHNIKIFEFKLTITYNYTTQLILFLYIQHMISRQYICESTKIDYDTINK